MKVEFSVAQSKKDQRVKVKKLDPQAKIPTRGSAQAAGHDLYANESKTIPAQGQEVVKTGISITPPRGTYGRIAPRSGMAVKHQIAVHAGVIDSDYTGEIKVVLVNMGNQDYQVKKGDRIAQLIAEKIVESDCYEVRRLKETSRDNRDLEAQELPRHRSVRSVPEPSESSTEDPIRPQEYSSTAKKKDA